MGSGGRVIAVLLTAFTAAAIGFGCGGKSDEDQVKDTVNQFSVAASHGDYKSACKDLTGLARRRVGGNQCATFLMLALAHTGLGSALRNSAALNISKVTIAGNTAIVAFTGQSSTLHLQKVDGNWLISGI